MNYLNFERLNQIDPEVFREQKPYPWINPKGLLTETGYERLHETLPDLALFERQFGHGRKYDQKSHDRYELEWGEDLDVARPWQEFVAELQGEDYRNFLRRLLEHHALALSFHWHYTPTGCSVSPHCDAKRKLGSHIFYFNTREDWDPSWGGETLILDDGGRFHPNSAPNFEGFDRALDSRALGNYCLPFARKGNSWHGVREIRSSQGALRKVFIVVITHLRLASQIRDSLLGRHTTGY
jgi:hypothetical protein